MRDQDWLAERFEESRPHLRAMAYRMLGSPAAADDAVQEAWLRLRRADAGGVENLTGWLTTVVARICLDMLRSHDARREEPLRGGAREHLPSGEAGAESEALLAESVGLALLVVLQTLAPAERVTFILHDMFDLPFDDIAPIVGRSPAAARQLASRARRRVRGASKVPDADFRRRRELVEAFLAASRRGDLAALLALLDPDVVLNADASAVEAGAGSVVRGAAQVAETFSGRARAATPALLDGVIGLVRGPGGKPRDAFAFTIEGDRITGIELIADPARLEGLDVTPLPG